VWKDEVDGGGDGDGREVECDCDDEVEGSGSGGREVECDCDDEVEGGGGDGTGREFECGWEDEGGVGGGGGCDDVVVGLKVVCDCSVITADEVERNEASTRSIVELADIVDDTFHAASVSNPRVDVGESTYDATVVGDDQADTIESVFDSTFDVGTVVKGKVEIDEMTINDVRAELVVAIFNSPVGENDTEDDTNVLDELEAD